MTGHVERLRAVAAFSETRNYERVRADTADLAALLSERDALAAVAEAGLDVGRLTQVLTTLGSPPPGLSPFNQAAAIAQAYDRTVAKP